MVELVSHQTENIVAGVASGGAFTYITSMLLWRRFSNSHIKCYKSLGRVDQLEWDGRAPSTLHALILSVAVLYIFLCTNTFGETQPISTSTVPPPPSPFVLRASPTTTATLAYSAGYFITDLAMLVLYFPAFGTAAMGVHHVAALASVLASALYSQGQAYTLLLLATEATTPFVNARWILEKAGLKEHPVYMINGVAMALLWLVVRVLSLALVFFPLTWRHAQEAELVRFFFFFLFSGMYHCYLRTTTTVHHAVIPHLLFSFANGTATPFDSEFVLVY